MQFKQFYIMKESAPRVPLRGRTGPSDARRGNGAALHRGYKSPAEGFFLSGNFCRAFLYIFRHLTIHGIGGPAHIPQTPYAFSDFSFCLTNVPFMNNSIDERKMT